MNVWKPVEWALVGGARVAWPLFQGVNRRVRDQVVPSQVVSGAASRRAHERTKPQLGFPRTTDSLCPILRAGDARAHPLRGTVDPVADPRHERRDQGRHPRARRQDHRREDLPDARHVRRHARDQSGVPASARDAVSGPRRSARSPTSCTTTGRRRSSTAAARC